MPVALALIGEVGAQRFCQRSNGFRGAGQLGQITEVPAGQRDDHEGDTVAAGEVLPVRAVHRVADALPGGAVDHRLGEQAEIACRGQGDVLQRDADLLAVTGGVAVPQRGDHRQRRIDPAGDIPGRQHVVDRRGQPDGSRHQWKADRGVDGVVDAGAAVGTAHLNRSAVRTRANISECSQSVTGLNWTYGNIS